MAQRKQITWEMLPREQGDALMEKHLYYIPGVAVTDVRKQIFVSGQHGLRRDAQGKVLNEGDLENQTEVAIERIKTILKTQGATIKDVVQVNVFLRDAVGREKHAEVRAKYFSEMPPASTLVGTHFIFEEMLIEINAIAVI
jgi:2-iminobutanoate/2-iminopropanoate deaminase